MLEQCWRQCMCPTHFPISFAESFHRLYGSTNIQAFLYYKNFPEDKMFQKCAVSGRIQLDLNPRSQLSVLKVAFLWYVPARIHPSFEHQAEKQQGFGLVAHDLHHRWILALSDRFVWWLQCPPGVALVALLLWNVLIALDVLRSLSFSSYKGIFLAFSTLAWHLSFNVPQFLHTANMDP